MSGGPIHFFLAVRSSRADRAQLPVRPSQGRPGRTLHRGLRSRACLRRCFLWLSRRPQAPAARRRWCGQSACRRSKPRWRAARNPIVRAAVGRLGQGILLVAAAGQLSGAGQLLMGADGGAPTPCHHHDGSSDAEGLLGSKGIGSPREAGNKKAPGRRPVVRQRSAIVGRAKRDRCG
jgi:hypothetical protein